MFLYLQHFSVLNVFVSCLVWLASETVSEAASVLDDSPSHMWTKSPRGPWEDHRWTTQQDTPSNQLSQQQNKAKQTYKKKKERHDFNIFKSLVHSDGLDDDAANVFNAKARSHTSHSCLFDSLSAEGCAGLTCSTFDYYICTEVSMRSALPNKTSAGICSCDDRWCRRSCMTESSTHTVLYLVNIPSSALFYPSTPIDSTHGLHVKQDLVACKGRPTVAPFFLCIAVTHCHLPSTFTHVVRLLRNCWANK